MKIARFAVLLICLAAAAAAPAETGLERRAETLLGYWFAPAKDAAAARVLRITNVVLADDTLADLAGQYGPPAAPAWPEARELTARLHAGRLLLDVVAADGARLALAEAPGEVLRARDGKSPRFARSSLEEVQRFVATRPAPEARARRDSVIELVYIGADDCSLCRAWEARQLRALSGSADWRHVRFSEVKLPTLREPFAREHLPERLLPPFDALMSEGLRVQGVPAFVLLVNGSLRAHALGPAAYESFVLPALRAAVREKLGKA